jgi:hypothetical protein
MNTKAQLMFMLSAMMLQCGCAMTYSLIEESQERSVLRDTYRSIDKSYVGTNGVITLHVTGNPVKLPKGRYTLTTTVTALEAASDTVYVPRESLRPGWLEPIGEVDAISSDNETFRHGQNLSALRPKDGEERTVYFWPERRFVFTQSTPLPRGQHYAVVDVAPVTGAKKTYKLLLLPFTVVGDIVMTPVYVVWFVRMSTAWN